MLRPGLLGKTVLLLLLVFVAAFLGVRVLYLPYVEENVRRQLTEVAADCLSGTDEILRRRGQVLGDRVGRQLEDLPFELVADKPAKIRELVDDYAAGLRRNWSVNITLLAREFRSRTRERIEIRSARLAEEFRSDASTGLLVLLFLTLGLSGVALVRAVVAPLGRLLRATERIAAGDLGESVGLSGSDEVGRLGRAFDEMSAALLASRAETEALNRTLEQKVREKTAALVHSETMASIGTLAGGVAHEFNNLLGGILGTAEDATEESDPEAVRESLAMILRTARRACNITENLLRFSRPPARKAEPADLSVVVAEALYLIGPEAAKREVSVRSDLRPLPEIRLDSGQIHQVVLNLLTNALHSMPGGGRLEVRVGMEGEDALIEVRDTGPGVPPEARKRIFDPFYTTREAGTGLGLSVSYSIVRGHGGSIEVENAEGGGAVFRVRLPVTEEE